MLPGSAFPIVSTDLTGRTVLVRGANTGLVYAAVLKFLRINPARLVPAVRDVSKGPEAAQWPADDLVTGWRRPSTCGSAIPRALQVRCRLRRWVVGSPWLVFRIQGKL